MSQSKETEILELLTRMDQRLANLEGKVGHLSQLADIAPDTIATVGDTFDGMVAHWAEKGIDFDQRISMLGQTIEAMSNPDTLKLLETVLSRSADLEPIFRSTLNAMDDAKQTSTSIGFMMRFMSSMGQSLKTA